MKMDNQFLQAILPAANGSLGVCSARLLALTLASAVGAKNAFSKNFGLELVNKTYDDALKRWFELGKIELAPETEIEMDRAYFSQQIRTLDFTTRIIGHRKIQRVPR